MLICGITDSQKDGMTCCDYSELIAYINSDISHEPLNMAQYCGRSVRERGILAPIFVALGNNIALLIAPDRNNHRVELEENVYK